MQTRELISLVSLISFELDPAVMKMQISAHLLRHSMFRKKVAVHFVFKMPELKFSLKLGWDNLIIFQTYMFFVLEVWGLYKICYVYISK